MEEPYGSDADGEWVEVGNKKKPDKPKSSSSKAKKGNNKRLRESNNNTGKNGKIDRPSSSQTEPNYKTRSKRTVTPSLDSAVSVVTDITMNMSKMSMDESAEDANGGETTAIDVGADPSHKVSTAVIKSEAVIFSVHDFHSLCSNISPENCIQQTLATRGLINNKSECFRNCILQSLFSLPIFRNVITHLYFTIDGDLDSQIVYWQEFLTFSRHFFFDQNSQTQVSKQHSTRLTPSISASEKMPMLCQAFDQLMSQYNPVTHANSTTQANNFTTQNKGKGGRKRSGIQQDAMEFLTFFLDRLHEELLTLQNSTSNSNFLSVEQSHFLHRLQHIGLDNENCEGKSEAESWNTVTSNSRKTRLSSLKIQVDEPSRLRAGREIFSTLISRLFHGLLRSEVSYKTKRVMSVTFQRFHCLTIDLAPSSNTPSTSSDLQLGNILSQYFREENVDDLQTITKCVKFEFLPAILVLQLNRFSFDYSRNIAVKVATRVIYPGKLEILPSFMSDSLAAKTRLLDGGRCFYQLQSVVLHLGKKATGGHYISYTRDNLGVGWRAVDDMKVNAISEEFALSAHETVYILFYSKIEGEVPQESRAAAAVGGEEKER